LTITSINRLSFFFSEFRMLLCCGVRDVLQCWCCPRYCFSISHIKFSSTGIVKSVRICPPNFQSFSLSDLERLKNDKKWLSDSHLTLSLLFVLFPFVYFVSISTIKQGLFSRLCPTKYLGEPEDPPFGHNILDTVV
jgi:hypothetical protein